MYILHYFNDNYTGELSVIVKDYSSEQTQLLLNQMFRGRIPNYTSEGIRWYKVPEYSYFQLKIGGEVILTTPIPNIELIKDHGSALDVSEQLIQTHFMNWFNNVVEPYLTNVECIGYIDPSSLYYHTVDGYLVEAQFLDTLKLSSYSHKQLERGYNLEDVLSEVPLELKHTFTGDIASHMKGTMGTVVIRYRDNDGDTCLETRQFKSLKHLLDSLTFFTKGELIDITLDYAGDYVVSYCSHRELMYTIQDNSWDYYTKRGVNLTEPLPNANPIIRSRVERLVQMYLNEGSAEIRGDKLTFLKRFMMHRPFVFRLKDYSNLICYDVSDICRAENGFDFTLQEVGSLSYDEQAHGYYNESKHIPLNFLRDFNENHTHHL